MSEENEKVPKGRFDPKDVDWEALAQFGITEDYLREKGLMEGMLLGYKTDRTVPIHMNFDSVSLHAQARLSFRRSQSGKVMVAMHGIRLHPELEREYMGHRFTEEEKKNLLETGNMGSTAELTSYSGQKIEAYVSLDALTNELCSMPVSRFHVPETLKGVTLSEEQKADLTAGKAVLIEGMTSRDGDMFDATVQVSADRRGLMFTFPKFREHQLRTICGVRLTDQQAADYAAGKAILVEAMTSRDGAKFTSYVKADPQSHVPRFTKYDPDSPADNRTVCIPRVVGGVTLTEDQRDRLRNGEHVSLSGVRDRGGSQFDALIRIDGRTGTMACRREEFLAPDMVLDFRIPDRVLGVKLTEVEKFDLMHGHAVAARGMCNPQTGEAYAYLRADFIESSLGFYRTKEDAVKRNRPDYTLPAAQVDTAQNVAARLKQEGMEKKNGNGKSVRM